MGAFEYRQAQEIRDVFERHHIKYLFIGKSGAILLGFPDTTQDAHLYVEKNPANCEALVPALRTLGFALTVAKFTHGLVDHYWSRGSLTAAWATVGMATRVVYERKLHLQRAARARSIPLGDGDPSPQGTMPQSAARTAFAS